VFERIAGAVDRLKQRYRVDDVPLLLRPAFLLYGYACGGALRTYLDFVHKTSRIVIDGEEHLAGSTNHIFCHWHEAAFIYPATFPRLQSQVWLQHPSWYMLPIHVVLRLGGVKDIILGSTGNSGRAAADALVAALRGGASTVMLPDGPYGPPHVLRKGALHVSLQSGVPIIPLRLQATRFARLPGWDRKQLPLPFGTLRARFGAPIAVQAETLEADTVRLARALDACA
jgi:lysophospholipid acyltransferase (LPLAT)-like uncharacterized protein